MVLTDQKRPKTVEKEKSYSYLKMLVISRILEPLLSPRRSEGIPDGCSSTHTLVLMVPGKLQNTKIGKSQNSKIGKEKLQNSGSFREFTARRRSGVTPNSAQKRFRLRTTLNFKC